jgi:hypothetical protein
MNFIAGLSEFVRPHHILGNVPLHPCFETCRRNALVTTGQHRDGRANRGGPFDNEVRQRAAGVCRNNDVVLPELELLEATFDEGDLQARPSGGEHAGEPRRALRKYSIHGNGLFESRVEQGAHVRHEAVPAR